MSTTLVRYEAARHALAEARRVDEVRDIRDKAIAMQAYARQAQDRDLLRWAEEIRLRAERRAGELLREMGEAGRRRLPRHSREKLSSSGDDNNLIVPPTLADLGVTRNESSTWQRLAKIPEREFERRLAKEFAEPKDPISTRRILQPEKATVPAVPRSRRNPGRPRGFEEALEEGRAWMARWRHVAVLAPVFAALTDVLMEYRGGRHADETGAKT